MTRDSCQSSKPILIVTGPTAGGKSALALEMSKILDGEIVNSDSVQIFREANIGSAKPSEMEQQAIPHHLYDLCLPNEAFNTASYIDKSNQVIHEIIRRGKECIVTGGSTLYITHLLHGTAHLPPTDSKIREELETKTNEQLLSHLRELDPESAERIHINDRLRLTRAVEACLGSGRPASQVLKEHAYRDLRFSALILVVVRDREELYGRISLRTKDMIRRGLVAETEQLREKYGDSIKLMKSLGYKEALDFLAGRLDATEMEEEINKNTRRYAKRQLTFWRNEPPKRLWTARPNLEDEHVLIDAAMAPTGRRMKPFAVMKRATRELAQDVSSALQTLSGGVEVWYVTPQG